MFSPHVSISRRFQSQNGLILVGLSGSDPGPGPRFQSQNGLILVFQRRHLMTQNLHFNPKMV